MWKTLYIITAFILVSLFLTECKKKENEKIPEVIIPEVLDFRGPAVITASGVKPLEYKVAYRAGSKYAFTPEGYEAAIEVPDTAYPNEVLVTWHSSEVDTFAYLICVETSVSGLKSDPDSLKVTLKKFCSWNIDDFTGTWDGKETGDSDTTLILSIVHHPQDGDHVLRVKAVADTNADGGIYTPPFLSKLFVAWGERFVAGQGNEGDVLLNVDLSGSKIIIENDYWGETLPGESHYWTGGSGTWCGCTDSIHLNFEMYRSSDFSKPNKTSSVEIVKQH